MQDKDTDPWERGIILSLDEDIQGIAASHLSPMDDIITAIEHKRVIYVGERHDRMSHHLAQLRVIEGLHRAGKPLAVGMEMFQRPFQGVLDRYLAGEIDEETFLRDTEYFTRWVHDYHLYRPIMEYCRENAIPVVALNLPREISQKVARTGLDSLSEDELEQVPANLDWSNTEYQDRLRAIFSAHPETDVQSFDTFYQAQVLWDETMAQSVHGFLQDNPQRQMVVIAGIGHVAFGRGIPSRVAQRGGYDQTIIASIDRDELEPEMADYFLFPADVPTPFTPRLGVMLEPQEDRLRIKKLVPRSPAEKAGLKSGDLLLTFDGKPVHGVEDLKIGLFFKKEGDTAEIKVKRIRRFAPDRILEVTVGPFRPGSSSFRNPHGGMPR